MEFHTRLVRSFQLYGPLFFVVCLDFCACGLFPARLSSGCFLLRYHSSASLFCVVTDFSHFITLRALLAFSVLVSLQRSLQYRPFAYWLSKCIVPCSYTIYLVFANLTSIPRIYCGCCEFYSLNIYAVWFILPDQHHCKLLIYMQNLFFFCCSEASVTLD